MVASMSRRGNCYDHAPMERFWASLKKEQVHHQHDRTRVEARADIFDYIESFYKPIRRHNSLANQSPMDLNATFLGQSKKAKNQFATPPRQSMASGFLSPSSFVHIDHHSRMIDPNPLFQPHMPLDSRYCFSLMCHWKRLLLDRSPTGGYSDDS